MTHFCMMCEILNANNYEIVVNHIGLQVQCLVKEG